MRPYTIPYIEVIVDESLEFACRVFGWMIPEVHNMYQTFKRSFRKTTVSEFIEFVSSYKLCIDLQFSGEHGLSHHIIPQDLSEENDDPIAVKQYMRTRDCKVGIFQNLLSHR